MGISDWSSDVCSSDLGHVQGFETLADNDFGRAAADVYHQPAVGRGRQLVGDSRKNKPGLFLPGDDFYGKAKRSFRARQDVVDVARDAKSVGCSGAYTIRMEVGQPFAQELQDRDRTAEHKSKLQSLMTT